MLSTVVPPPRPALSLHTGPLEIPSRGPPASRRPAPGSGCLDESSDGSFSPLAALPQALSFSPEKSDFTFPASVAAAQGPVEAQPPAEMPPAEMAPAAEVKETGFPGVVRLAEPAWRLSGNRGRGWQSCPRRRKRPHLCPVTQEGQGSKDDREAGRQWGSVGGCTGVGRPAPPSRGPSFLNSPNCVHSGCSKARVCRNDRQKGGRLASDPRVAV